MNKTSHLELLIALLIAVVSTTLAATVWRIDAVSSSAGDASRQGIIDTIKKQSGANEDWRKTYEEAGFAEGYAAFLAQVQALETSGDPNAAAQAASLRQYLLPNLQMLGAPLSSDPGYQKADGTYDLQKRFADLEAASPDLSGLDPQASFTLADRYASEQRWLTVVSVLLAISLFWLALAEVGGKRMRLTSLVIGALAYAAGLLALVGIEAVFLILRGGVL